MEEEAPSHKKHLHHFPHTGEKTEIKAVGWMKGRESKQREKNKQGVEGATEGVEKTIRGKNNRQQEGQEDGRETEITDRQERSGEARGFRMRTKGKL